MSEAAAGRQSGILERASERLNSTSTQITQAVTSLHLDLPCVQIAHGRDVSEWFVQLPLTGQKSI